MEERIDVRGAEIAKGRVGFEFGGKVWIRDDL